MPRNQRDYSAEYKRRTAGKQKGTPEYTAARGHTPQASGSPLKTSYGRFLRAISEATGTKASVLRKQDAFKEAWQEFKKSSGATKERRIEILKSFGVDESDQSTEFWRLYRGNKYK